MKKTRSPGAARNRKKRRLAALFLSEIREKSAVHRALAKAFRLYAVEYGGDKEDFVDFMITSIENPDVIVISPMGADSLVAWYRNHIARVLLRGVKKAQSRLSPIRNCLP